eukprot:Gb_19406 [translate_table: standard]
MAVAVPPKQEITELMHNLKLDDQPKSNDVRKIPAKDGNTFEAKAGVLPSSDAAAAKENKEEVDTMVDQGLYYPPNNYYGVYYPGHETHGKEWDDHFVGVDAREMQYPGIRAENGSLVYYTSGYGYPQHAYNPYNPYIPGALVGADGQFLGHQPYYTGPAYQHPVSSGYFPPVPPPTRKPGSMVADRANANGTSGSSATLKPAEQAGLKGTAHSSGPPSQSFRPMSQIQLNQQQGSGFRGAVLAKDYIPFRKFAPGTIQGKGNVPFTNSSVGFRPNGRGRGKVNGNLSNENWNLDVLTEQNRGPRTNRIRNHPIASSVLKDAGNQAVVGNSEVYGLATNRDQYNRADFSTTYDAAKFFVIKSYSEDDVHKSIKYNVWASTPNGNKRLDEAYQDAQQTSGVRSGSCPVFLFFSVNASGQFCGVAEMIGSVDFNKSMDFWQQDKWSGFFPVKWHMIKDIPNSQFRQIILENNDNKPVTNSRDTQEIKYGQGVEMLNIFKNYSFKTSILDDFMFYEGRQKAMKDKKLRQQGQQQQELAACIGANIEQNNLEEQFSYKKGEEEEVPKSCDLKVAELSSLLPSANGSQLSALNDINSVVVDHSLERKEEMAQSKGIMSKEIISKEANTESQIPVSEN